MNQFENGGNSVAEQARGLKDEAKDRASSTVKEQMDTRSTQAGEQMQKVAGAMRQSSDQFREQAGETPAKVNDAVAEKIEQLSTYLTNAKADTMLSDLENVARRRPWLVPGLRPWRGSLFPLPEGVGPHPLRAGVWHLTAAPRAAFHSSVVLSVHRSRR